MNKQKNKKFKKLTPIENNKIKNINCEESREEVIESIIQEHLLKFGYNKTFDIFTDEKESVDKVIKNSLYDKIHIKLIENFENGDQSNFFKNFFILSNELKINNSNTDFEKIEFEFRVFFTIYYLHPLLSPNINEEVEMYEWTNKRIEIFEEYLQNKGNKYINSEEFSIYFKLPFILKDQNNSKLNFIFEPNWINQIKETFKKYNEEVSIIIKNKNSEKSIIHKMVNFYFENKNKNLEVKNNEIYECIKSMDNIDEVKKNSLEEELTEIKHNIIMFSNKFKTLYENYNLLIENNAKKINQKYKEILDKNELEQNNFIDELKENKNKLCEYVENYINDENNTNDEYVYNKLEEYKNLLLALKSNNNPEENLKFIKDNNNLKKIDYNIENENEYLFNKIYKKFEGNQFLNEKLFEFLEENSNTINEDLNFIIENYLNNFNNEININKLVLLSLKNMNKIDENNNNKIFDLYLNYLISYFKIDDTVLKFYFYLTNNNIENIDNYLLNQIDNLFIENVFELENLDAKFIYICIYILNRNKDDMLIEKLNNFAFNKLENKEVENKNNLENIDELLIILLVYTYNLNKDLNNFTDELKNKFNISEELIEIINNINDNKVYNILDYQNILQFELNEKDKKKKINNYILNLKNFKIKNKNYNNIIKINLICLNEILYYKNLKIDLNSDYNKELNFYINQLSIDQELIIYIEYMKHNKKVENIDIFFEHLNNNIYLENENIILDLQFTDNLVGTENINFNQSSSVDKINNETEEIIGHLEISIPSISVQFKENEENNYKIILEINNQSNDKTEWEINNFEFEKKLYLMEKYKISKDDWKYINKGKLKIINQNQEEIINFNIDLSKTIFKPNIWSINEIYSFKIKDNYLELYLQCLFKEINKNDEIVEEPEIINHKLVDFSKEVYEGFLKIKILHGISINPVELAENNIYVKINLTNIDSLKTKEIKDNYPEWNQEFNINYNLYKDNEIELEVYNLDEKIGSIKIPENELINGYNINNFLIDKYFNLINMEKVLTSSLYIQIGFFTIENKDIEFPKPKYTLKNHKNLVIFAGNIKFNINKENSFNKNEDNIDIFFKINCKNLSKKSDVFKNDDSLEFEYQENIQINFDYEQIFIIECYKIVEVEDEESKEIMIGNENICLKEILDESKFKLINNELVLNGIENIKIFYDLSFNSVINEKTLLKRKTTKTFNRKVANRSIIIKQFNLEILNGENFEIDEEINNLFIKVIFDNEEFQTNESNNFEWNFKKKIFIKNLKNIPKLELQVFNDENNLGIGIIDLKKQLYENTDKLKLVISKDKKNIGFINIKLNI